MILKELMRERLDTYSLPVCARISAAADMMRINRVGSIVIVDDDNSVIGIITDRDIAISRWCWLWALDRQILRSKKR